MTSIICVFGCAIAMLSQAANASVAARPEVDGVVEPAEWAGARREPLKGGGDVWLVRDGSDLFVAVLGPARGLASLCVGGPEHVEVLHASAALGAVTYRRSPSGWLRGQPFTWLLRDEGSGASPSAADRRLFLGSNRWISTSSRSGAAAREFRIALDSDRRFLGAVFLSTESLKATYWPPSMADDCRDLDLLRGEAPPTAHFDPERWWAIPGRSPRSGRLRP